MEKYWKSPEIHSENLEGPQISFNIFREEVSDSSLGPPAT